MSPNFLNLFMINAAGQWIDRSEHVDLSDLFEKKSKSGVQPVPRVVRYTSRGIDRQQMPHRLMAIPRDWVMIQWPRQPVRSQKGPRGSTGCYRLWDFVSTASTAESFRSRCGSLRRAPVCSSQASPVAAPQVGQGTDKICFGVSSLVFTTP
jgi:hypothetical protein